MLEQISNSSLRMAIEISLLLLVLVFLEAVLYAVNAFAVPAILQRLEDKQLPSLRSSKRA